MIYSKRHAGRTQVNSPVLASLALSDTFRSLTG